VIVLIFVDFIRHGRMGTDVSLVRHARTFSALAWA
jgi:hypothetical protein